MSTGLPRSYPRWFLQQSKTGCPDLVVGYSRSFKNRDSSVDYAFRNGCVNYIRQKHTFISGGQAFWDTEIGAFWLGSDIEETFDTARVEPAMEHLKVVDTFYSDHMTAVLLSPSECRISSTMKSRQGLSGKKTPSWVSRLPKDGRYEYALGVAQSYYYEPSSWLEAERSARKSLAGALFSIVRSLEKQAEQYSAVVDESLSVHLANIEVVERWRETGSGIYYVLIRMPR